jgi:hypothetical protein
MNRTLANLNYENIKEVVLKQIVVFVQRCLYLTDLKIQLVSIIGKLSRNFGLFVVYCNYRLIICKIILLICKSIHSCNINDKMVLNWICIKKIFQRQILPYYFTRM